MRITEKNNIFSNDWGRFAKELPIKYQLKYAPILTQVIVIRRCNITYRYCNEFNRKSEPVSKEDIFTRIDKLSELGTVSIEFSGGEPLLHPYIADIISYATKKNFLRRMLITNGMLLSQEIIENLNDSGLQHMQISIDGVLHAICQTLG